MKTYHFFFVNANGLKAHFKNRSISEHESWTAVVQNMRNLGMVASEWRAV